jgi:cyclic pyranopterin phosphate synthase
MVDVGDKAETERVARARGRIHMTAAALELIAEGAGPKGDVESVARLAGIQAAKRTADLIPLCHPLQLTHIVVEVAPDRSASAVDVTATVRCRGRTGVEMEALTAVSIALLTVYDMVKAVDKGMTIDAIRLISKTGGVRGDYERADDSEPTAGGADPEGPESVRPPG